VDGADSAGTGELNIMPIYHITASGDSEGRFPRLGTLRKGQKKPNDRQPGPDLGEQLRFAGVDADVDMDWAEAFGGALVDELDILLPYAGIDDNWQAWREHYGAGSLKYRCDGINHVLWQDDEGNYHTDPKPCPGAACLAKPVGRLEIMVPRLGRLGTITLTTTSFHDIRNLDGALRAVAIRLGSLQMLPLRLTRVKRMISMPRTEKGKNGVETRTGRVRAAKWLLHLEPSPEWVRAMLSVGHRAPGQLPGVIDVRALAAPVDLVDPDDAADDGAAEGAASASEVVDVDSRVADGATTAAPPTAAVTATDAALMAATPVGDAAAAAGHWTPCIAACGTVSAVEDLLVEIEAIDQPQHRDNVRRLAYARIVELTAAALDKINWNAGRAVIERTLAAAVIKLDPLPADTPGRNLALDKIESARQRLDEERRVAA